MATQYFLERTDAGRAEWLNNFAPKLAEHATALGIDAPTLSFVTNAAAFVNFLLAIELQLKTNLNEWTAFKRVHLRGKQGDTFSTTLPTLVSLGATPPAAPTELIMPRILKLVNTIKNHPNYTESIGRDLRIIGAAENIPDTASWQPKFKLSINAGKVIIKWVKGKASSIDFYVDRGRGEGFQYLGYDTRSPYEDAITLPAGAAPQNWTYRAIYRLGDTQVGQFSLPVSILVSPML